MGQPEPDSQACGTCGMDYTSLIFFGCNIVGSAPFSAIDLPDLPNTIECSTSCAGVG
jgi:hypothetical protein